jgi:paraquat-inducible protein B
VRTITLDEDLTRVLVTIDMSKEARRFATKDTRFWVVRPQIGASGVTGLGTLLSGAYIGVDTGKSEEKKESFVGMEDPPAVAGDQKGKLYTLHADSLGSVDVGSPCSSTACGWAGGQLRPGQGRPRHHHVGLRECAV